MPGRWDMRAQSPNPPLRECPVATALPDVSDAYAQPFVPGHHGYETGKSSTSVLVLRCHCQYARTVTPKSMSIDRRAEPDKPRYPSPVVPLCFRLYSLSPLIL